MYGTPFVAGIDGKMLTIQSYKYYAAFPNLPDDNTHVVVCVRFRWTTEPDDTMRVEKLVTTAYLQSF
jgi:hypothetical protein